MEIYVGRHGETRANRANELQGHCDTPLTERGNEQAKIVASELSTHTFDMLFSSPLKRALDTAKILAQEVNTDIRIAEQLKEMCYGDWEGESKDELSSLDAWDDREADKYNFRHPGSFRDTSGESYAAIYDRVADFFDGLRSTEYERVLVVSHLGVLRNARKHFENCTDAESVTFSPDPLQVYVVQTNETGAETEIRDYS
jgi:broad specificity phosphatase PhoE